MISLLLGLGFSVSYKCDPYIASIDLSFVKLFVSAHLLISLSYLQGADGVLVPGGFGDRGVQGKILAAKYARENRIPYLGICLGMQIAVIEFARSILGLKDANSTEFDPQTKNPCVIFMPEVKILRVLIRSMYVCWSSAILLYVIFFPLKQGSKTHMGGTMRLGSRTTFFQTMDCKSAKL